MKYLGSIDSGKDLATKEYIDLGDLDNQPDQALSAVSEKSLENRIVSRYLRQLAVNFDYDSATGRFVLLNAYGQEIGDVDYIGGSYVYKPSIRLIGEDDSTMVADGTHVSVMFNYTSLDENDADDGNGTGVVVVNGVSSDPFAVPQGNNSVEITSLLSGGENVVSVRVENPEHLVATLNYKVTVMSIQLSTNLSSPNAYFGDAPIDYVVSGYGSKVVHFEMDGVDLFTRTVTTSGRTSNASIPSQAPGQHTFRIYATCTMNGLTVTSNVLTYNMVWASEALPEIALADGQHAVRYMDLDGTYLYGYAADDGDPAIDPVTQNLIEAPIKEGSEGVRHTYSGWNDMPSSVNADCVVLAKYTTSYLVTFMNESTQCDTQWIVSGLNATTPATAPTRPETSTYGYRFDGWTTDSTGTTVQEGALLNVTASRTVYAVFTQLAKHTVRFMNGTTVLQTKVVLDGENAEYTGADPVHPSNPEEMKFIGWEPSAEKVTADVDCQPVWLDTSSKTRKLINRTISTVSDSLVTYISTYAFFGCSKLSSASFQQVSTIGAGAFSKCNGLMSMSFPNLTSIGDGAFCACSAIGGDLDLTTVEYIGSSAFLGCYNIKNVITPALTAVGASAFYNCQTLSGLTMPVATNVGSTAFGLCQNISFANIPNLVQMGESAFYRCSELMTVDFPKLMLIPQMGFAQCVGLTSVSMPLVSKIGNSAFASCTGLLSVSFPVLDNLGTSAFSNCTSLSVAIIGTGLSKACSLTNSNAFGGTNEALIIYVPDSLVESYKTSVQWSALASRIKGISELPT